MNVTLDKAQHLLETLLPESLDGSSIPPEGLRIRLVAVLEDDFHLVLKL